MLFRSGIELVLADDLAEPVADLVTGTIAVPVSVGILGRKPTLIGSSGERHRLV